MMQRGTRGPRLAVSLVARLCWEVIWTQYQTAGGWMAALVFLPVLRYCAVSLRIFMASHLSRFGWSIGPMRRARVLAEAFSALRRLPVLTASPLTVFV